jgi:hypothetical protein
MPGISSFIFKYSYIFFSFSSFHFHHMVLCSWWCSSFVSFCWRHSSWFYIMRLGVSLVVLVVIFLLALLPLLSSATLCSWFCGTCVACHVCPSCTPQINVSPLCQCHENTNNCDCRCLTQQNFHDYHLQWSSHLGVTYNNTFVNTMNNYLLKRRLLFWLIGLAFFNLLLLFCLGTFVFFAPELFSRWIRWRSRSRLQRRKRIMHNLNLAEPPVSSIELPPLDPLSSISPHLHTHSQLMADLTKELQSVYNQVSPSAPVTTDSRIT